MVPTVKGIGNKKPNVLFKEIGTNDRKNKENMVGQNPRVRNTPYKKADALESCGAMTFCNFENGLCKNLGKSNQIPEKIHNGPIILEKNGKSRVKFC